MSEEAKKDEIAPNEDEQCCSCTADNLLLHVVEPSVFTSGVKHQHCDLCFETFAGNACQYPSQYPNKDVLQHINLVANILLRKIGGKLND